MELSHKRWPQILSPSQDDSPCFDSLSLRLQVLLSVPNSQVLTLRRQMGIDQNTLIMLYAGRLLPARGPDILLEALSLLPTYIRPFRVLIIGEESLKDKLRGRAAALSHQEREGFLGSRQNTSRREPTLQTMLREA